MRALGDADGTDAGERVPHTFEESRAARDALQAALDRFRLGEDLHAAAAAEGVAAWRLLEEAQAMPDPAVTGPTGNDLVPFVRRRD